MKSYKIFWALFLWVLCCAGMAQAQVRVEKVDIESEFCGPFNKNCMEIIFYNPTEQDSLEGSLTFYTNKTAFVKDMWLEIDGKLEKAETYSRNTGERIYNRVTGRRLDPALLTKWRDGKFTLRVFPVRAKQSRRVVVEYYSVLDTPFPRNVLCWNFSTNPFCPVEMELTGNFPPNTLIEENNNNLSINDINRLSFSKGKKIQLNFIFSNTNVIPRIHNNNLEFFQVEDRVYFQYGLRSDKISLLKQLINLSKNNQIDKKIILLKSYNGIVNNFFDKFIDYLCKNKNMEIFWEQKYHTLGLWRTNAGQWEYVDQNLELIRSKKDWCEKEFYDIECPFLDLFIKYNDVLGEAVRHQKQAGFLTNRTVKLVLENDERVMKIRQEELDREHLYYGTSSGRSAVPKKPTGKSIITDNRAMNSSFDFISPPPPANTIMPKVIELERFCVFEEGEQPRLYRMVTPEYPEIAKKAGLEGTVLLEILIGGDGRVKSAEVIRSLQSGPGGCDEMAKRAALRSIFTPARQRGKPIAVKIILSFRFFISDDGCVSTHFHPVDDFSAIDGRKFIYKTIPPYDFPLEYGYDETKARRIKYLSDEYFDFLYENSRLIDYCHSYSEIGLKVDSPKWGEYVFIVEKE